MSMLPINVKRPRRVGEHRARRHGGFSAGLATLVAVSTMAALGLAGSEVGERRAFVDAPAAIASKLAKKCSVVGHIF